MMSLVFSVAFVFFTFTTFAKTKQETVPILSSDRTNYHTQIRSEGKTDGLAISPSFGATFDEDGELLRSPGSNLPQQDNVFTPEHVLNGRLDDYVSLPVIDDNVTYENIQERVKNAIARKVGEPFGLLHQGTPPGHDAVMGLATYHEDDVEVFRKLVGSLRTAGFNGHIILGVIPSITNTVQSILWG